MKKYDKWFWLAIATFIVLIVLSIAISGCGKMMRGTGLIIEGLGDGVTAAGEHLQESTSGQ